MPTPEELEKMKKDKEQFDKIMGEGPQPVEPDPVIPPPPPTPPPTPVPTPGPEKPD
jgi:hypothetical protein